MFGFESGRLVFVSLGGVERPLSAPLNASKWSQFEALRLYEWARVRFVAEHWYRL